MDSSSGRSDPRTLTAEEEAIKLNTDCVYFLASPLTCKKGSECEYRHSEDARLNPRDCRFWLSGNCLNPKCLFRHPPLDGMAVSPRTTAGKIFPSSHVPPSAQLPMSNSFTYNFGRNNVPCYYFLKGACLKGDKCPFMHGPPSVANPVAKQNPNVSAQIATLTEAPEKCGGKINEPNNQQNFPTALNIGNKLVNGSPPFGKGGRALENAPGSRNGLARSQTTYDPARSSSSYSSSQNLHVLPERQLLHGGEAGEIFEESTGVGYTELERPLNLNHQLQSPSDHYQNAQNAEEIFRDSSPGFDVLVDHVVMDTDYFHGSDGFRSGSQGRRMNLRDDYDHYHSDYESSTRLDGFRRDGAGEFLYGNEHYDDDWDQHKTSSTFERMMDGPLPTERNLARRLRSPDEMDASDLRHRLRKQSRRDGSFSATSSVHYGEPYSKHDKNMKGRYHKPNSYRDQQLYGRAISSRLRGRMTLPRPPSPEIISDLQDGRDKGRGRVRLSPVKLSGSHRSLGQRLGRRTLEESFAGPRYFDRQLRARDAKADLLDFAGPKSLETLKGAKADRNSEGQSIKHSPSNSALEHNRAASMKASRPRDSAASVDFEGPKPLSVLLKRKRESGSVNDANSTAINNGIAVVGSEVGSRVFAPTNLEIAEAISNLEEPKVGTFEESLFPTEEEQINYDQKAAGEETEAKDAIEDEDPEYTDQRDGEYYYNAAEGGDYKTEDDDVDHIDEDLDAEEDEDDFAKKIGLIFSS